MKFAKLQIAIIVAVGFAGSLNKASATPFTFDFTSPAWTYNFSPLEFGSALSLSITVDNGGSSSANQSYNFSNITSVAVNAIGGSLSTTFDSSSDFFVATNGVIDAITTDASSLGTLALSIPDGNSAGRLYMQEGNLQFQIGQMNVPGYGGWTPLLITDTANYLQAAYQEEINLTGPVQGQVQQTNPVPVEPPPTGNGTNNIPEPSSVALLGLGLLGFSLTRRKKFD